MRILSIALVICLLGVHDCFALEWKRLHKKADTQGLMVPAMETGEKPGSPLYIEDSYVRALVYLNLHKDKEAEGVFREILSYNPDIIEAKWGVAEVLRRRHDLAQAEAILSDVIKSNQEFYPAYISLAYIKYIRMDFKQAVRLSLKVIQAGKNRVDLSNYVLAYCLYAGAKGTLAHYGGPLSKIIDGLAVRSNLEKAQQLNPHSAGVMFGLGSFYLIAPSIAGGDKNKAESYLKEAVNIDPYFADAYVRLAQLYRAKGNNALFEKYLNEALKIDPGNELALDTKSGACRFICARTTQ